MADSSTTNDRSQFGDKNVPACTTPIDVKIEGKIPDWVHGVLYRVGKSMDQVQDIHFKEKFKIIFCS